MPNRILRDGILTSERIGRLNWAEEVFYRRLISVVDDYGRYYATPMLIRAACYPLLLDKVSDSDIEKWTASCQEAALVRVYPALDGKRYIQLLDFRQQVRAKESKFPEPPDTCTSDAAQVHSKGESSAHLDVGVDVDVSRAASRRFTPPSVEEVSAYCVERGNGVDPQRFCDFYEAKGWMVGKNKMKSWKASVRTWEKPQEEKPGEEGAFV